MEICSHSGKEGQKGSSSARARSWTTGWALEVVPGGTKETFYKDKVLSTEHISVDDFPSLLRLMHALFLLPALHLIKGHSTAGQCCCTERVCYQIINCLSQYWLKAWEFPNAGRLR